MKTKQTILSALILTAAMLACVSPAAPAASSPAPVADSARLETMVAETVSAAIAMTESAPTATLVPTITPTVTPTREIGDSGSSLTASEDGTTTLFIDDRAGYQIVIPEDWLPIRIDQKEYYDAWSLEVAGNPSIQSALLTIQDKDPNVFRLLVLDINEEHLQSGIINNLTFIWDEQVTLALDSEEELQAIADGMTESTPGLEILSQSFITPPSGLQYGLIESQTTALDAAGEEITLYQKIAFFNVKTGMQAVTLTTSLELKDEVVAIFDSMLATVEVK